jgi:hypothetical protein
MKTIIANIQFIFYNKAMNILEKAETWVLYKTWEDHLEANAPKSKLDSVSRAIQIKELLYSAKDHFFTQHFDRTYRPVALSACLILNRVFKKTPNEMILYFETKTLEAKVRVAAKEKSLLASSWHRPFGDGYSYVGPFWDSS